MRFNQKSILAGDYLRLSDDDGDKPESNSIRNQRSLITDYVKHHDDITLVDEYVDDGYSGTNFDRPAFKRMIEDAKKKKINCVIVKDLSRLGRNYIETGRYLEKIFPILGVRFIAVTDHYDSGAEQSDADQIIVPFKNLINDAYCRDISIKIRSQLDVKRKNGQFIGSFAGYGYQKDPEDKNHLIIDEYAAEIVRLIFKMRVEGFSAPRIACRLNEMGVQPPMEYKRVSGSNYDCGFRSGISPQWAVTTVLRILNNELYTGVMVQGKKRKINYKIKKSLPVAEENWIRVASTHEAIIPPEIFQYVQELGELDTRTAPEEETVYLFSGFLRCGDCGQNMVKRSSTKNGKKYHYYHCSTYKNGDGCSSHLISEKKLVNAVLKAIQNQIALVVDAEEVIRKSGDSRYKKIGVKAIEKQISELNAELVRYREFKVRLYQDYVERVVTKEEYKELNQNFNEKVNAAEGRKQGLEAERDRMLASVQRERPWIEDYKMYRNITSLDRKVIVTLIDKITVMGKDEIAITFRYQNEMDELLRMAGDGGGSYMRCVSYTRSTSCFKGAGIPADIITRQNKNIRDFMKKNGWKLTAKYSDRRKSGDANEAFEQMTADGVDRKFDMVVVDSLDRCGKYISCAEDVLLKTFFPAGIHFAVASDGFCSIGKSAEEVKEYVAEIKKNVIISSIRAHERECQLNGLYTVHDEKYGYLLSDDYSELVIDEEAAAVVREIFRMLADGIGYTKIMQILNERGIESPFSHLKRVGRKTLTQDDVPWSMGAVKRIAFCTAYVGYWQKVITGETKILPIKKIVDKELYEKAHAQIKARTTTRNLHAVKRGIFCNRVFDAVSGQPIYQRTFQTGETVFVRRAEIKDLPKNQNLFISFEKVQEVVKDAVRKEMCHAEHVRLLIREGFAESLKQEALEECYRQAEIIFQKMLAAEEPRLPGYRRYVNGESAEADYLAEKERIEGTLAKHDKELKTILDHTKDIGIAYSEENPWLIRFTNAELPETLSKDDASAWVQRIDVREFSEVMVTLTEMQWKNYFPEGWFVEG